MLSALIVVFSTSLVYRNHFAPSVSEVENIQDNFSVSRIKPEIISPPVIVEKGETTLTLGYGSNLTNLLTSFGANKQDAQKISDSTYKLVPAKTMKSGQTFFVKFTKTNGSIEVHSIEFQPSLEKKLLVEKDGENYSSKIIPIKLTPTFRMFEGNIGSSFYSSAVRAGVSADVIKTSIELLSYVVNFQHGIKSGASFKILTEALQDPNGKIIKIKSIKFIELKTGGQSHRLFAFDDGKGSTKFYNERGESVVRSLLQTPIQMARPIISSGFGTRVHPCLGFTREHKGVDFAAPPGTPVLAAGEGKVVFAGWSGSYGNLVHIVHSSGFETKYAHLKFINKGIRPGATVTQRQAIGGVGTTGMSTGPHLHFEVILNKKHINPMKVSALPVTQLCGAQLKKFKNAKIQLLKQSSANTPLDENTKTSNL